MGCTHPRSRSSSCRRSSRNPASPAKSPNASPRRCAAPRAPGTRKAYARAFRRFEAWCLDRGFSALPSKPEVVALYLAELADTGLRLATLRSARAGVKEALAGLSRADTRPQRQALPLNAEALAGLSRADTRPQRQALPLNAEALAAIRGTARTPKGRETPLVADRRGRRRRGDLRRAPGRAAPAL